MSYQLPINRVVECLKELADEDFQRRVWLASSGPEMSSFDEAICQLFDDTRLSRLLEEHPLPVITTRIDESLRDLERLVTIASQLFQSMSPDTVIDHPKMHEIRGIAARALLQMEQDGVG